MSDELLIESVRGYIILYDPQNRYYHDNVRKENAWSEVSKKTGNSAADCKKRWTLLRDAFRKALRGRKTVSGQAPSGRKKWKYEDVMSFLIPFYSERGQRSNLAESQPREESVNNLESVNDFDDESPMLFDTENVTDSFQHLPSDNNITSPATSESRASTSKSTRQPNSAMAQVLKNYFDEKQASRVGKKADHLQKFFDAMLETVRTFSPLLQIEIKSKISSLVSEYEVKNLEINQIPTATTYNRPVQHQVPPLYSNSSSSSVCCSPLISPTNQDNNYATQWQVQVDAPSPQTPTPISHSALSPEHENTDVNPGIFTDDTPDGSRSYRNF